MIRVLVVDDEPMVCTHLRTILGSAEDIEVVGQAQDGAEAVEAVLRLRPGVVLMDLRMPGVDGVTAIERIARMSDAPYTVALTTFDDDTHILQSLEAGAIGFLIKSTSAEDLIRLVRVAADGHAVMSPPAMQRLVASSGAGRRNTGRARDVTSALTEREVDVLTCLGEGLSNSEIGARLHLAETTVKSYVSRMLPKLDCTNRTQAGLLAHEAGLVEAKPRKR
ncbi:response regulator transcription factor [Streptomonospora sediminis]